MLEDGRYDAFVVWCERRDDGRLAVSLTITSGERRGDVVDVVAARLGVGDPLDAVGLPCTLVVAAGEPRVEP